jgi:hypothetical protein
VLELGNGISIEIGTANFRTVRGYTICAALLDEASFWNDSGANPDQEILTALRPAMATVPQSVLLVASSPYRKAGILYDGWRKHFGQDGEAITPKKLRAFERHQLEQKLKDDKHAAEVASRTLQEIDHEIGIKTVGLGFLENRTDSFVKAALVEMGHRSDRSAHDVGYWHVASLRGNVTRLSLSERSGHEPAGQIGHIGRE